jgi:hypothetical protein
MVLIWAGLTMVGFYLVFLIVLGTIVYVMEKLGIGGFNKN